MRGRKGLTSLRFLQHDLKRLPARRISFFVFFCTLMTVFWSCASYGTPAKSQYFKAESCYRNLKNSPEKQKYRSYWLDCIGQFEAVGREYPSDPWAPAGLFKAANLYEELYGHSYKDDDIREAAGLYRQVIEKHQYSVYKDRAAQALTRLPDIAPAKGQGDTAAAKKAYMEAESSYAALRGSPDQRKFRSHWMEVIRGFEKVHQLDPQGPWAAAGLYMTAVVYSELYRYSYRDSDQRAAREIFQRVVKDYPDSAYRSKAEAQLADEPKNPVETAGLNEIISGELGEQAPEENATGDDQARDASGLTTVTGIRYWSNPQYTRVVIDADGETEFQNNLLKKDPDHNKTRQRLYVDLQKSRLGDLQRQIPINDSLLESARAGQYTPEIVRVVVDIKSFENYNIFSLKNPFRIVIDVRGESDGKKTPAPQEQVETASGAGCGNVSIARQLALGVGRIVIDPGHGGKDYGAPGYLKGIHEKHVTLAIARKLAESIRRQLNCEVILTRDKDTYLTLEERTAIANTHSADLFISIHANASRNNRARGIETYFLNLTADDESINVAARENATSRKNISELQTILNDLLQNAKINESSRLATYVQNSLFGHMSGKYQQVNNKGIKQAPFYVLLGAQMPAILVETAFISNKQECQRLMDADYQDALCDGIIRGIRQYMTENKATAFLDR